MNVRSRISTERFRERFPELTAQIEEAIRVAGGPWEIRAEAILEIAGRYGVTAPRVGALVMRMRGREVRERE